jgi:CRP-like cAMP-binding protein
MTTAQDLAQLDLFADLPEEWLADFAALAEEVTCPPGETLFCEGCAAERVYVLLEGKVTIRVGLSSRPEDVMVASLSQPGQLVGWSGAMQPDNYSASAVCQEETRLLAFDGARFMDVLRSHPPAGLVLMQRIAHTISGRLRNLQRVVLKTL